jgi:predicted flap endonuclease-1-like 5' DNA nuclease
MLKGPDDLEIIEGNGPKIAERLNQAGVHRFRQLAQMTAAQIQPILDRAGPNFALTNPGTWPEQAALAANNQWASLKALQGVLVAGLRN